MKHTPFLFGKGLLKKELTPYQQEQKEAAIESIMENVLYRLNHLANLYGLVENKEAKDKVKKFSYKLECVFSEWHINTDYHTLIKNVDYWLNQKKNINFQSLIEQDRHLLDNYFKSLKLLLKVDYSELI